MRQMLLGTLLAAALGTTSLAQAQRAEPQGNQPFEAGTPLETTGNVRVFGSFRFAESCVYDEERDLYVTPNAGVAQDVLENDGYVSLINPDGTVHTLKWIGVNRNVLTLNHPLGSDAIDGEGNVEQDSRT